jgi:hypothetical protein
LGVGEIGATGQLHFREQKNSSEARFADATTIDERQAGRAAGSPASFLELFSFRQRKKWNVFPYQRRKSYKKSRLRTEKK